MPLARSMDGKKGKRAMSNGKVVKVSGPLVVATGLAEANMADVIRVGEQRLIGEVLTMTGDAASIQVYEETSGLGPGAVVETTGAPLSVELGPGLIGMIYDGSQRPLELIARIRSNIRRYYSLGSQAEAEAKESRQIRVGDLVLDEDSVTLKKGDQVITITPTEYKMLSLFMKSPGKVFTKMQIYQAVNGECYVNDDNTLMVHISNLRDKIEDNPREPRYIKNIRGIGYKIEKL